MKSDLSNMNKDIRVALLELEKMIIENKMEILRNIPPVNNYDDSDLKILINSINNKIINLSEEFNLINISIKKSENLFIYRDKILKEYNTIGIVYDSILKEMGVIYDCLYRNKLIDFNEDVKLKEIREKITKIFKEGVE